MLANVIAETVVLAKGLVALGFTAVTEALCFAVSGAPWSLFGWYMLLGVVGALPVILLSLVARLASRDQMTAGLYSVPVLLLALAPGSAVSRPTSAPWCASPPPVVWTSFCAWSSKAAWERARRWCPVSSSPAGSWRRPWPSSSSTAAFCGTTSLPSLGWPFLYRWLSTCATRIGRLVWEGPVARTIPSSACPPDTE